MIPGVTALAETAIAEYPAGLDASTPDPFLALLALPDADFVFLLEAHPYDIAASQTVEGLPAAIGSEAIAGGGTIEAAGKTTILRASDSGYKTVAGDSPAHTPYPKRLEAPFNVQFSLFSGDEPDGRGGAGFGEIKLVNADGRYDGFGRLDWTGRRVEIYAGAPGFSRAQFVKVLSASALGVKAGEGALSILLRDRRADLDRPMSTELYGGAGGLDGGADIASRPKPQCYGICRHVPAILIDRANQVYQVNDGAVLAIDAVKDRGLALTPDGDVSDVYAWAPVAGKFVTDLARGIFRLGAAPAGAVRADARGDSTGGYVETTGAIVRRIAVVRGLLKDPADLELGALATLDRDFPGAIGLFVGASQRSVIDVINELMAGAGGFAAFNREGRLAVGQLRAPADPVAIITDGDLDDREPATRETAGVRSWRRRLGYRRVWAPEREEDLAGGVSDADKDFLVNEFRFAESSDNSVLAKAGLRRQAEQNTFLDNQADAEAEADRRRDLYAPGRVFWRVSLTRGLLRHRIGETVTLKLARHGLAAGRDFVVVEVAEIAALGQTKLRLWG